MTSSTEEAPAPVEPRLWPAAFILIASAVGFFLAWLYSNVILGIWIVIFVLATAAWHIWLFFLSRLKLSTKLKVFIVPIVMLGLMKGTLRVDYYDGDTIPRFALRWTKPAVVALQVQKGEVDLLTRTPFDVPDFLGVGRVPVFPNVDLATDWKSNPPKEIWRQPIGEAFSSFAVVGDFAVTLQQRDLEELVVCYQWKTGKALWTHADKAHFTSTVGGNGPRTTPVIHKGRVYTLGATGILNCLDGKSGKVIWSKDIVKENKAAVPMWGKSGTPLLYDKLVVASAGGPNGKSLVAYHQDDGKEVWSAGSDTSGYSSPMIATLAGTRQVLIVNKRTLVSHDAQTGAILWQNSTYNGDNCSQPLIISSNEVFYSKGYGRGSMLLRVKKGSGTWEVEEVWRKKRVLKTKFTNPILYKGFVYGISGGSALECVDPKTGKSQWREKGTFGHGQLLLVKDKLLLQTEMGKLMLIETNPKKYQEFCSFQVLNSRTWNYPVLVKDYLLVRNESEAACFQLPLQGK
jgi:outer membrane protein assembly factor BamB